MAVAYHYMAMHLPAVAPPPHPTSASTHTKRVTQWPFIIITVYSRQTIYISYIYIYINIINSQHTTGQHRTGHHMTAQDTTHHQQSAHHRTLKPVINPGEGTQEQALCRLHTPHTPMGAPIPPPYTSTLPCIWWAHTAWPQSRLPAGMGGAGRWAPSDWGQPPSPRLYSHIGF